MSDDDCVCVGGVPASYDGYQQDCPVHGNLIERLRSRRISVAGQGHLPDSLCVEAADRIEQLEQRNAELEQRIEIRAESDILTDDRYKNLRALATTRPRFSHWDELLQASHLIEAAAARIADLEAERAALTQIGWAYRDDRRWDEGRWHPCLKEPNQSPGRLIRPIYVTEGDGA